jgi:hypothetical protein
MVDMPICEVGVTHHLLYGLEMMGGKNVVKKENVFVERDSHAKILFST